MTSKKSISILIGIIGLLLILLAGSVGFIIGNLDKFSKNNEESSVITDNSKVLKEIEELKLTYDSKIADKTLSYNNLQSQKDSISALVEALERSKNDANSLVKYKTQFKSLESKMRILVNEIVVLKTKKSKFLNQKQPQVSSNTAIKNASDNIVTKTETNNSKLENIGINKENQGVKYEGINAKQDVFFSKVATTKMESREGNTDLVSKKIEKFAEITLSNVKANGLISKSATKKIETNEATKTDLILIQFTLDENQNAKTGEKLYYFQIIDGKNNVLGKRVTQYFDNESLTYSFSKSFTYENQAMQVSQEFLAEKFLKGTYRVNIYDRDALVGKTTFILK